MSPWTKTYTAAQLTQQLQKHGLGVGTSVKSLDLTYSQLGNVIQVVVRWANGQSTTISASNIRSRPVMPLPISDIVPVPEMT